MSEPTPTQNVIDVIDSPFATREDIAAWYAAVIRYEPDADWAAINRAILERYRPSGLSYIKKVAWQLADEALARAEDK